jgi:hypothetical protein
VHEVDAAVAHAAPQRAVARLATAPTSAACCASAFEAARN